MIQYRVRPVTRYLITRYEERGENGVGRLTEKGEYSNAQTAFEVAKALCKAEHDASGEPLDSQNFGYPRQEDMFPKMTMDSYSGVVMAAAMQGSVGSTAKEALGI